MKMNFFIILVGVMLLIEMDCYSNLLAIQ